MSAVPTFQDLPLPEHGRPAFGGVAAMHALHAHSVAGLPGCAWSVHDGWAASCVMRAWAQWVREQGAKHASLPIGQLVHAWKDLPLLLDGAWVWQWEREKPWAQSGRYMQSEYQALLDSETPSQAYDLDNKVAGYVWQTHLEAISVWDLATMFDTAAELWAAWARQHPEQPEWDHQIATLVRMGTCAGLDATQAQAWAILDQWLHHAAASFSGNLDALTRLGPRDNAAWAGILAAVARTDKAIVSTLLAPTSPLVGAGLWRAPSTEPYLTSNEVGWKGLRYRLVQAVWREHRQGLVTGTSLSMSIAPPPSIPKAARERWGHLGLDLTDLVQALQSTAPVPFFVVTGQGGMGKSQLCMDLATLAGRELVRVRVPLLNEDGVAMLAMTLTACALLRDPPIVQADMADESWKPEFSAALGQVLRSAKVPLLLEVPAMNKIPNVVAALCMRKVWLNDMPLPARIQLAQRLFADEQLALRVARTLRCPGDIQRAADWCTTTGSWTWTTVNSHQHSHEQSMQASKPEWERHRQGDFEVEPVSTLANLPPLAGLGQLDALAKRLTLAFHNPQAFAALGGAPPKGAILVGPPGTGKTLFARHLAARLGAPLIVPDTTMLCEHPTKVAELFAFARQHSPCVVLLDEAASLICHRFPFPPPKAFPALLAEIDGVESLEGVLVVATSNNGDIIEPLVRSGRLSEVREVGLPLHDDREAIWQAYLQGKPLAEGTPEPEEAARLLAQGSRGLTGADIAEAIRRAAGEAVSHDEAFLSMPRLMQACDAVRWAAADGLDPVCEDERWSVAVHEAGHALMVWRWNQEVQRITVRSRRGALGMVQWAPPERQYALSRQQCLGRVQVALGGLAAEQALFGAYASGGQGDLKQAQNFLLGVLTSLGMGGIGPVGAGSPDLWSDQRRRQIETESELWAKEAFAEAVTWLGTHRDLVERLARQLIALGDMSPHETASFREEARRVAAPLPQPPAPLAGLEGAAAMGGRLDHPRRDAHATAPVLHLQGPHPV